MIPAVTNGNAPIGLAWMESYLDACNGQCGQTAMAIHWYADASDLDFALYLEPAYNSFLSSWNLQILGN